MIFKELKQAIEETDIKMRPLALYINPQDDKKLRECIPDLEHRVLIISTPYVDPGKVLLINRNYDITSNCYKYAADKNGESK